MENKKKILLTGATGFLGRHIEEELSKQHDVVTLGRSNNKKQHITADLKAEIPALALYDLHLVIHAAGKAHIVPKTEEEKKDFYDVNLKGTENLLTALKVSNLLPKAFVFISTVAVYGREKGSNIEEEAPLLAEDPYGKSKKFAEAKVLEWGKENSVKVTILRLPLIIGKNAPGNFGSMLNGIKKGYYFNIGKGTARRSMILATDVVDFIIKVYEVGGIYNVTDGVDPSYGEISQKIGQLLNKKIRSMPVNIARFMAVGLTFLEKVTGKNLPFSLRVYEKMTNPLTFSSRKAQRNLGWKPQPVLEKLNTII